MAEYLYSGDKKKYQVKVTSSAGINLSDRGVDFTVHFYVNGKYSQGHYDANKADCTFVQDEVNTFTVVCNTVGLPTGALVAVLTIKYSDGTKDIVESVALESDSITILPYK